MPFLVMQLLLTALLLGAPASALEFPVTRTDDPQPTGACDPGDRSLREAVLAANSRPGTDLITLPPGVYDVSGPGAYEDAAAFGDLDITDDLTILGSGADTTTIRVVAPFTGPIEVFQIDPAQSGIAVEIADVTISSPFDTRPGLSIARCALNDGTLLLSRVIVRDCTDGGSAIASFGASLTVVESTLRDNATTIQCGGGIFAVSLTVIGSTISNNQALCGGGIFANELNLVNSTISGNSSSEGGGGVYTPGPARIANVTIAGNRTDSTPSGEGGGGLFAFGTVEVSNTIIPGA